jgi:serine/threonine protein phosphatase PrpC
VPACWFIELSSETSAGKYNAQTSKIKFESLSIVEPKAVGGYVRPGDVVVVGSAGLWSFLSLDVIESVARAPLPSWVAVEKLEALVREHNSDGLTDDFGVVIMRF